MELKRSITLKTREVEAIHQPQCMNENFNAWSHALFKSWILNKHKHAIWHFSFLIDITICLLFMMCKFNLWLWANANFLTWTFCFQIELTSNAQVIFITCWYDIWKMRKQHLSLALQQFYPRWISCSNNFLTSLILNVSWFIKSYVLWSQNILAL
jgi:hypothetical protein